MDSLLVQMNQILAEYTSNVDMTMQSVINVTARDAVQILKTSSPKQSGDYAKNWAVKKQNASAVIYNKAPTYRLTHLLEHGHDIIVYGVKVGRAPAHPHIKPVEEWVQDEVVTRLSEALR